MKISLQIILADARSPGRGPRRSLLTGTSAASFRISIISSKRAKVNAVTARRPGTIQLRRGWPGQASGSAAAPVSHSGSEGIGPAFRVQSESRHSGNSMRQLRTGSLPWVHKFSPSQLRRPFRPAFQSFRRAKAYPEPRTLRGPS
jgi:hypothetical protein